MHQVRQGEPGGDLQAFPQTPWWAGARRAQGSWGQFVPLTAFTVCRLEQRIIYFCVLGLSPWKDLSSVLNTEQCRSMRLVQSGVTVSQDGLEVALLCGNTPVRRTLLLLGLCSSRLVPAESLLGGAQGAAPLLCSRAWEGDAGWGCSAPGSSSRGAGWMLGSWSQHVMWA